MRWGLIGVYFGATTIIIVFIIGAILAPSISLDASSVAALAIESKKSYEEIVESYGVFLVICGVLVKARFVFDNKANYVGLGLLLFAGIACVGAVFVMKMYQFVKNKLRQRHLATSTSLSLVHRVSGISNYIRLTKWKHMGIYFVSVASGIWQLGVISSYSIYFYCEVLSRMFTLMTFMGLAEELSAEPQCYNTQATLSQNLGIILGSFGILSATFLVQASNQCKKNISESLGWIDDEDVPRLSHVWSLKRTTKQPHIISVSTTSVSWDSANDSSKTIRETSDLKEES